MSERLPWHRSTVNRVFAGVCGGLAESWGTDPNLVRLLWALLTIWTTSVGIILYIGAALFLPKKTPDPEVEVVSEQKWTPNRDSQRWVGLILILAGGYWLLQRFLPDIMSEVQRVAFPLVLIIVGLWLVLKERKHEDGEGQ